MLGFGGIDCLINSIRYEYKLYISAKCILKWLVSASKRIRPFQLPVADVTFSVAGATVHHSVNKHFEINTNGGRLADWHVRSIIGLV